MITMDFNTKVYIAGHTGLVGAALVRRFKQEGFKNFVLKSHQELDLTSSKEVNAFFKKSKPQYIIIAAAKVGGIAANIASPVDFLVENLKIQNNLLEACQRYEAKKTIFLGSSCIYPREAPQPMLEEYLMHGPVEPTNASYAIAKIAGICLAQSLCKQYGMNIICPIPCNVYGQGDHFEFERSHVISALVRRFAEAKQAGDGKVTLWGTGNARREFLHVDDCADACMFLMKNYDSAEIINVGFGQDFSISELAAKIAQIAGYKGDILWDHSKPDGMPRKLLDVTKLHKLGWKHRIGLDEGLGMVFDDFYRRKKLIKDR